MSQVCLLVGIWASPITHASALRPSAGCFKTEIVDTTSWLAKGVLLYTTPHALCRGG